MHAITPTDWPDFRRLLNWWRSTHGRGTSGHTLADPATPETAVVVLMERLDSGGNGRAVRLAASYAFTQDIFLPDLDPVGFRLMVGTDDPLSEPTFATGTILPEVDAQHIEETLRDTPLGDLINRVELGYGNRWKVIYNRNEVTGPQLINDPEQPGMVVSNSGLIESGEFLIVSSGIQQAPLVAGTLCQVSYVSGQGWIVTEAEQFPPAPSPPDVIFRPSPIAGCARQVAPAGFHDECNACGVDGPSRLRLAFSAQLWPRAAELFPGQEHQGIVTIDLVHDTGCIWQSDLYYDDTVYWRLEMFLNATAPPAAKLQLLGQPGSIYGPTMYTEGIDILYWNANPFDALSLNQLQKIPSLSVGTPEFPRHDFPGCVTISPQSNPCETDSDEILPWNCVDYWRARVNGTELIAGPAESPEGQLDGSGCEWPPFQPSESGSLEVLFIRNSVLGWVAEATVIVDDVEVHYRYAFTGATNPSCFAILLTAVTSEEDRGDLPSFIEITPWQK